MTTDIQKHLDKLCSIYEKTEKLARPKIVLPQLYTIVSFLKTNSIFLEKIKSEKNKVCMTLMQPAKTALESIHKTYQETEEYYHTNQIEIPQENIIPLREITTTDATLLLESHLIEHCYGAMIGLITHLMTVNAPSKDAAFNFVSQIAIIHDMNNRVTVSQPVSIESLNIFFHQVKSFIDQHKIYNKILEKHIKKFENCPHIEERYPQEKGPCKDQDLLLCKYSALISILQLLINKQLTSSHHILHVQKHANINLHGEVLSWLHDEAYNEFLKKKNKIKNTRSTTAWDATEKLMIFHESYDAYGLEAIISKSYDGKRIHGLSDIGEYYQYALIVSNFIRNEQKNANDNYIANELIEPNQEERNSLVKVEKTKLILEIVATLSSDTNTITLTADGKEPLEFERYEKKDDAIEETKRFKLFLLLLNNMDGISKKEARRDLNIDQDQLITAGRGIDDRVRSKWNLREEYIEQKRKFKKIKINNRYPTTLHYS